MDVEVGVDEMQHGDAFPLGTDDLYKQGLEQAHREREKREQSLRAEAERKATDKAQRLEQQRRDREACAPKEAKRQPVISQTKPSTLPVAVPESPPQRRHDIFISYAKADRERAEQLAKALETQGWSVWWDPDIPAGQDFDDVIERELNAARCVVVLWSEESIRSRYVKGEAREALDQKKLIPVFIADVKPPMDFRAIQGVPMVGWQGGAKGQALQTLATQIKPFVPSLKPSKPAEIDTTRQRSSASGSISKPAPRVRGRSIVLASVLLLLFGLYYVSDPFQPEPDTVLEPPVELPEVPLTGEQLAKVAELLEAADLYREAGRLAAPPGDSAYDIYQKILEIDPRNETARQGMREIAERYVQLARDASEVGDLENALTLVELGLRVNPSHKGLQKIKDRINERT